MTTAGGARGERKGDFQIFNGKIVEARVNGSKESSKSFKKSDPERMLKDFIRAHRDLVDKEMLLEVEKGTKQATSDALYQIH